MARPSAVDSRIRRADPAEAATLGALALRSKAHWGYDDGFLAACRDDLALAPEDVATSIVVIHDGDYGPAGFYRLLPGDGTVIELDAFFVEPAAMGQGVGRRLWQHAVVTAAALGFAAIEFQSDPHAVGFYEAMGARQCGVAKSTVTPGRLLPLMRFPLR